MSGQLQDKIRNAFQWLKKFSAPPLISDVETLVEFVRTRSAYIGQTSLYGYLKTRMGTRYRDYFDDDRFSTSMRIAAVKVSLACREDLSIFAAATAGRDGRMTPQQITELSCYCFENALNKMIEGDDRRNLPKDTVAVFRQRAGLTDWNNAAVGENAFSRSPLDLVQYAPVVDEFKVLDRQIVMNSIRFRWRDIRDRFQKSLRAEAVCRDWFEKQVSANALEPR